jgi:hypothetical protein
MLGIQNLPEPLLCLIGFADPGIRLITLDSPSDSDFGRIWFGSRIMFPRRIRIGARILIPPLIQIWPLIMIALRIFAYVSTSHPILFSDLPDYHQNLS